MEMHDVCEAALNESGKLALATAVHVEGHAYRKQGVSMLFTADGRMIGSISPGCIETDLALRAEEVMKSETAQLTLYDMRPADDLSWGEHTGCGGILHILLEPVTEDVKRTLGVIKKSLDQGYHVTIHKLWSEVDQTVQNDVEHKELAVRTSEHFKSSAYGDSSSISGGDAKSKFHFGEKLYVHTYAPKPRLLIIGAGDDSILLASLAGKTGFRVTVADWREALLTTDRFPSASLCIGFPDEIYQLFQIRSQDYVLLMSHQFPKERAFLELLQHSSYHYLGILGSRTRKTRLIEGLSSFPNLHAPVGITIGSEGPEEIAVSIVAELIAVKRRKYTRYDSGKEEKYGADSRDCTGRWSKQAHG